MSYAPRLPTLKIMDTHHIRARRAPRDRYGLALTTAHEAAAAYDIALGKLLTVQSGAEHALRRAVGIDPGFALGHAALALLGHEFGVGSTLPPR